MFKLSWISLIVHALIIGFISHRFIRWVVRRRKLIESLNHIPGPRSITIIGNALDLGGQKGFFKNLIRLGERYRCGWYKVWLGLYPVVFVQRAELVQAILTCKYNLDKDFLLYPFLEDIVGTGLVTSPGEKWRGRRKMLTPAFHFSILEEFPDIICHKSAILVDCLSENLNNNKGFDVLPYMRRCTLDIICETSMGLDMNIQLESYNEYLESAKKLASIVVNRVYSPWQHSDFIFKRTKAGREFVKLIEIVNEYGMKAIETRRKELGDNDPFLMNLKEENKQGDEDSFPTTNKRRKLALLDLLIAMSRDSENNLDDAGILEEINTFMFAGFDTTSQACSWALYLLGHRPDLQEKIVKELNEVAPKFEEGISLCELGKLDLLERCIKETLRIYPVAPIFSRRITHQLETEFGPVAPGTTITMNTYLLHRDQRFFPDSETFDPDRFLPKNSEGRHPFSYVPFSAGYRKCIGMRLAMIEIKIMLAMILKKFVISSIETPDELDLIMDVILINANGIKIKISERKSEQEMFTKEI